MTAASKRRTRTLEERIDLRGEPQDPVLTVRNQANGEVYDLVALCASGRRRFSVGASPFANLTIRDQEEYISSEHCFFYFEKQRLFVKCLGAKNRTLVNGVPLKERSGNVELIPGAVLTLGITDLLICGSQGEEQEVYVMPAMWRLLLRAVRIFGVGARTAARLGIPARTFTDWRKRRFPPPEQTG